MKRWGQGRFTIWGTLKEERERERVEEARRIKRSRQTRGRRPGCLKILMEKCRSERGEGEARRSWGELGELGR